MKYLLSFLFCFGFLNMFSRNNIFIITENLEGMISAPTSDSIFVTGPSGGTNVQVIPHLNVSLKSHNSELNIIFKNVTEQGYKIVENGPMQLGFHSSPFCTYTWCFANLEKSDWNLLLEGHTDNVGDDVTNMRLSQERAQAVSTYLIKKGIGSTRIEVKNYGETRPIATNDTEQGRKQNRRVEMKFVFK